MRYAAPGAAVMDSGSASGANSSSFKRSSFSSMCATVNFVGVGRATTVMATLTFTRSDLPPIVSVLSLVSVWVMLPPSEPDMPMLLPRVK